MTKERSQNSFYESFNDIKVSLKLFRDNWEPFVQSQLLAVLVLLVIFMFLALLMITRTVFMVSSFKPPGSPREFGFRVPLNFSPAPRVPFIISLLPSFSLYLTISIMIIFYTFISTSFGLAHDIIVSGDQFTEFENSFDYFKKNFFNYGFISLIILLSPILLITFFSRTLLIPAFIPIFRSSEQISHISYSTLFFLQYILFIIFSLSLVNISSKKSLKDSIKVNFQLLLKYPKRILTTWIICFIILIIPLLIMSFLSIIVSRFDFLQFYWIIGVLLLVLNVSIISLCYPFMSLVSTRIYVTTS